MSSRKRKQSSRGSGSPNIGLLGLIVLLVIILVGGYLFYQNTQQNAATTEPEPGAANAEQPEQQVGDLGRKPGPTLAPGVTVGQIGSGGSLKNDWYELYFTNPIYPDKPTNHKGGQMNRWSK